MYVCVRGAVGVLLQCGYLWELLMAKGERSALVGAMQARVAVCLSVCVWLSSVQFHLLQNR